MEAQLFTLTDSNEDGLYDRIDITAYITATIEDIRISDNEYYVYFIRSSCYDDMMIINENSSDANYEIYLDGEQITASDLQAGDVLSIICDELFNLEEASFYKIYVSRNTCTSKLTKIDTDEQTYTFANGETYELSFNNSVNLYLGNTYVLYFDVFGKIAYAEKSDSDNTYDMSNLNVDNNMAVYVTDTDDGEMSVITAYVDGAETTLAADVDFDLNTGDAFFYTKDSDGYVNKIVPVLANSVYSTYAELYKTALDNKFNLVDADVAAGFAGDEDAEHTFDRSDKLEDCKLIFGAIVDYINYSSCGEVVFATNITNATNVDISICNEYDLPGDAIIYKYDYNCGDIENRISTVSPSLFAYSIPKAAFTDDDYEVIDFTSNVLYNGNWSNDNYGKIRFALLKVIDNEITEAVIYVPSSEKG